MVWNSQRSGRIATDGSALCIMQTVVPRIAGPGTVRPLTVVAVQEAFLAAIGLTLIDSVLCSSEPCDALIAAS